MNRLNLHQIEQIYEYTLKTKLSEVYFQLYFNNLNAN